MSNDLLLSIPFFTLMGAILERCGLAEDLLEGTGQLFGQMPGGLAYAVDPGRRGARRHHRHRRRLGHRHGHDLAADHDALWLRHADRDRGYRGLRHHHPGHPAFPRADRSRRPARPVGRRHVCGRDRPLHPPGRCSSCFHRRRQRFAPHRCRRCRTRRGPRGWPLVWRVARGMVPSIVLIFLVLGTIFMGLATPTEAGAMGAVGAVRARGDERPLHLEAACGRRWGTRCGSPPW